MPEVPDIRIRQVNREPVQSGGDYVLYWMTAARRVRWNFGLQHAADWARRLDKPLVILEALRCDYPYASDRLHRFILQGMADNRAALSKKNVTYQPYLEPSRGAGKGLLAALAGRACLVVTDDYPGFFLPRMLARAGKLLGVRLEAVDGNGLLPMAAADRTFTTAHSFRRFLQKNLPAHLERFPRADPLGGKPLRRPRALPAAVTRQWPAGIPGPQALAGLPLDHRVAPVAQAGGQRAALRRLGEFLLRQLSGYAENSRHPDLEQTSRLSAYLHFGHISSHQVFAELMKREGWNPEKLPEKSDGSRTGWWKVSADAEAFLDQLVTWREIGFNMASREARFESHASLPAWARKTLAEHAQDKREHLYGKKQFESARTHDPLWNAAQRQLLREGRIHNTLRMIWGKKILQWTRSPRQALKIMLELNDKYALDGRDPNSVSGIFWVLGRYDRAWGPERKVFGKIRYMSSTNTRRKVKTNLYLDRHAAKDRSLRKESLRPQSRGR